MKINKSILGVVILFVFILSSCSQARYGSRTRRVKGSQIVQQKKNTKRYSKESGLIVASNEEAKKEVKTEVALSSLTQIDSESETIHVEKSIIENLSSQSNKSEKAKRSNIVSKAKVVKEVVKLRNNIESKTKEKIKEQAKVVKAKPNGSSDVGDIVYILVVVLLVLLILSLVLNLGGLINALLGLALLIFLIWLLLQLL
ncbi:MAG: hypothetical protein ACPGTP_03895 [Bacteroidia bacterium]